MIVGSEQEAVAEAEEAGEEGGGGQYEHNNSLQYPISAQLFAGLSVLFFGLSSFRVFHH